VVFGANAITAYMISELLGSAIELIHFTFGGRTAGPLIYSDQHFFAIITDPGWRAFVYSVCYTAVCFIPVWILYWKKILVKV
jgi:predicted acyltransferase